MISNTFRALSRLIPSAPRTMSSLTSAPQVAKVDTTARLAALRQLMTQHNIEIYIVPSEDAHQSEYIAPVDGRREFISGFTGSAGCAVISATKAALSTDGRYFLQAEQQLDSNWELLKQGMPDVPTWQEWALREAEGGKNIGVDATLISAAQAKDLTEKIKARKGGHFVGMDVNLVDAVWAAAQPARPKEPLRIQPIEYTGKHFAEKLDDIRKEIDKQAGSGLVVSMLDEIAWLFNLRGNDIPYNPVFFAYAFVTPTTATLYIDEEKITAEIRAFLGDAVAIKPYDGIFADVKAFGEAAATDERKLLVTSSASFGLTKLVEPARVKTLKTAPIECAKAIKSPAEVKGMVDCHVRDGVAQIEYFSFLEAEFKKGREYTEVTGADALERFRAAKDHFVGLSFPTISSSGPNGAIIHYEPEPETCARIDPDAIYLCDSGAQFLDGTTDSTRTLHYGTPTADEIRAYTLVLKGHIALARAVFPKGSGGFILDILARQYLWKYGLDYRHGTGHGVGSFLNVHEGPIGVGTRIQYNDIPLEIGNVISNEPGYYEDGKFGIRIESCVLVVEKKTPNNFGGKKFYGFETLTMVPYCKKLTDVGMLDDDEKLWLNEFHAKVYETTKSYFKEGDYALEWLKRETAPIAM
ncbi:peptidase M24, structural domain-containing protein [Dipodascopsis tothii]|uniref:peptidase M24, structural domain-containing protein n=1 Tax=Dipodascopsis tothii TaxID=44089 RepID=UPI0034CF01BD